LLISKGVDIREGDRKKMTPLMIASKYGRVHNVKLLLDQVQEELERKALLTVKSREG
jgi:ankyrin repeat protein